MYNNPYMPAYMNNYNQQNISDRIDNQIAQLQQMKEQMKNTQTGGITQNFQLAPSSMGMRYANSINDVQKELISGETPFFSKDMSVLWVKNTKNEIRTYELTEILPKDSKDIQIEYLQAQIEELKKGMKQNESNAIIDEPITSTTESKESPSVSTVSKSTKKSKWSSRIN